MPIAALLFAAAASGSIQLPVRPMTTDRPDTTESPISVARGRFQIEASLAEYAFARDGTERTHSPALLPVNLKYGLTDDIDVQLVLSPYERSVTRGNGARSVAQGFGDTQLRVKFNLWGNDGGKTAFAIMPFAKLPTGDRALSNKRVEGGIILPLAFRLPGDVTIGTMLELDLTYDEARDDYGIDVVHTATVGAPIAGPLGGYVEYIGVAPHPGGGSYRASASGGLTYALSDDWVIDAGGTIGLTGRVDRVTAFVGTSFRF